MKKGIIFILTLLFPLAIAAQSKWELPTSDNQPSQEKVKKETKKHKKSPKVNTVTEVVDGKTYKVKDDDRPYLAGAVPEIDGKVVFSADIETTGLTAADVYQKAFKFMEDLAKEACQTEKSKVAIVDPQEYSIVGTYAENLVFHKNVLQIDGAMFNYIIIANCTNEGVHVSIERLSYDYTVGKETTHMTAEDTITDDKMLSNNGTKLKKYNSKFRKATVDRMREIISNFRAALQ